MRIAPKEKIAGHSALAIRALLASSRDPLDVGFAARRLGCRRSEAATTLAVLVSLGYLETVGDDCYRNTVRGNAFAGARANAPLRRTTAERLVNDVIARACEIERDHRFVYVVKRLAVFGSYLEPARDRLGDVDLLLEVEPRDADPERRRLAFEEHMRGAVARGKRFGSFLDELAWPETEVKQYLRGRSKHVLFHSPSDAVAAAAEQRVLYDRASVVRSPASSGVETGAASAVRVSRPV